MNRNSLGKWGEEKAKRYLLGLDYQLLAANWRNRLGEIDLIMLDHDLVIFVEVRTKSSNLFGSGYESVNSKKLQQLRKMAAAFLQYKQWSNVPVRFDVISIDKKAGNYRLKHIKNVLE